MKGCLNIIVFVCLLGLLVVKYGSSSSPPATSKNSMEAMIQAAKIEANKPEYNTIESKKRWLKEEREIALQEGDLDAVKALDAMIPAPTTEPKEVVAKNSKASSAPSDCDASSKITGFKYNVIGSGIPIRKEASQSSDQVINQKATSIFKTTQYSNIDYSTTVFEECTKGEWSWIRIVEPEHLQYSHRGWVMSKSLDKGANIVAPNSEQACINEMFFKAAHGVTERYEMQQEIYTYCKYAAANGIK